MSCDIYTLIVQESAVYILQLIRTLRAVISYIHNLCSRRVLAI